MRKSVFFFIIFLMHGCFCMAQVVNIEKKRNSGDGFHGNIDMALSLTENSKQIIQGKNNIKLQYGMGKNTVMLFNDLTLMQVDDEKLVNDGFQHLRYNYVLLKKVLIGEVFVQHQYNTIKKLNRRILAGGGPRLKLYERDTLRLFCGPLVMYEYEELSDGIVTRKTRLSCYISFSWDIRKIFSVNTINYYQPNTSDFADYRISSDTSLKIKITGKLNYKVTFGLSYDSRPPEEVNDLFYSLVNGLSYQF